MRRLKIGILGTRGIPNRYGGFEQFAEYLSLGLTERGHSVSVYNSSRHPYSEKEWNGVRILHCTDPEHKLGTFGQFFYDLNCINDARKRDFDILLHLGYTSDSVWHWRWPKNTINMVNVDGMEWMRSKFSRPVQRFLKWAEALAANNAQVLIADSPHMQDHFMKRYGKKPVYIPYGAEVFANPNDSIPVTSGLEAKKYYLLVARMEPENNIEMIVRGYLESSQQEPLVVIGNTENKYGSWIRETFNDSRIHYLGPVYDQELLSNLRYYSRRYFHGHSVGGTNPSLLEAMGCGCQIAAHNNLFNRDVLQQEADYFSSASEVAHLLDNPPSDSLLRSRRENNLARIRGFYSMEKNIGDYERLMLNACGETSVIIKPAGIGSLQRRYYEP